MADINLYAPGSGRLIREDGTIANIADGVKADGNRLVDLIRLPWRDDFPGAALNPDL